MAHHWRGFRSRCHHWPRSHHLLCHGHGLLCHPRCLRCEDLLPPFLQVLQGHWNLWLPSIVEIVHDLIDVAAQLAAQPCQGSVLVCICCYRAFCAAQQIAQILPYWALAFTISSPAHGCTGPGEKQLSAEFFVLLANVIGWPRSVRRVS